MTKYEKKRKELHEALAEFTRLTGTGNVKLANLVMIQIVHFLVDLIEHLPKGCGGNCQCGSVPAIVPPAPAPVADDLDMGDDTENFSEVSEEVSDPVPEVSEEVPEVSPVEETSAEPVEESEASELEVPAGVSKPRRGRKPA